MAEPVGAELCCARAERCARSYVRVFEWRFGVHVRACTL